MADNYLITGYCGKNHVTAENDRGIHAGIFGAGLYVLPVGKQFKAENIGNNTIRIYDGKLVDNGAAAGIPAGEYVDLVIPNASQGMKRNDLIVFRYMQDSYTLIESGTFEVVRGTETSGTASDPALRQEDLLSGSGTFDQMPLWRIPVSTGTISTPVQLFKVSRSLDESIGNIVVDAVSSNGSSYTATVEDLEELYVGLEITIIPSVQSASTTPKLNVNGLGEKYIRRALSSNTATTVPSTDADWMSAGKPVALRYNGTYWVTELPRTNAPDLYGIVPIEKGGTGSNNADTARSNLSINMKSYMSFTNLGLENTATPKEVLTAMPSGSVFMCGASDVGEAWNVPVKYGTIVMIKQGAARIKTFLLGKTFDEGNYEANADDTGTPNGEWAKLGDQTGYDKLWENASPDSEFSAQTLSVPGVSAYSVIMIITAENVCFITKNRKDNVLSSNWTFSAANFGSCSRLATVTENNTIVFSDCYTAYGQSNSVTKTNVQLKPIDIYGVKGVS